MAQRRRQQHNSKDLDGATETVKSTKEREQILKNTRKRSRSNRFVHASGIRQQTLNATAILIVAIAVGSSWNKWFDDTVDYNVRAFFKRICDKGSRVDITSATKIAFCHQALVASRRTHRAMRTVFARRNGQEKVTLLEIPRRLTIWDLDALRDPWIQEELFPARIGASGPPLEPAAYLSAYLARLFARLNRTDAASWHSKKDPLDDPLLKDYFNLLPNTADDFAYHPLFWLEKDVDEFLGKHTSTYQDVTSLRSKVLDEYEAFSASSTKFASEISYERYLVSRSNVLTRSFGTGRLQPNEASGHVPLHDELQLYKNEANLDLANGCHAMVPVLDMYDHHANPNVEFSYDTTKRAFVVHAIADIPAGASIFDSYGKRTDPDLFSKYGFVNGDGSEYTQASLALWHRVNPDSDLRSFESKQIQRKQILRYLQYDDGYGSCVENESEESSAWKLKRLKYKILLSIANVPQRWLVRMPPRKSSSLPATASNVPITLEPPAFDMQELHFDGTAIFSTCRLITLTHLDYDGNAHDLLESNLQNGSYILPPTKSSLEFRTLMCIARMSQTALGRFGVTVEEQTNTVNSMNQDSFRSRNWTVAHLHLGEMQTLEALKQTAFAGLHQFRKKIDTEPAFSMRDGPCDVKGLQQLLEDYETHDS